MPWKRLLLIAVMLLAAPAWCGETSLVLLYTNDIHDHLRPDYDGVGGMPYVAGYVEKVREENEHVLLLDAGDVMEKGDLVAHRLRSTITYDLMAHIGYDAAVPGNHDDAHGDAHLLACARRVPGMAMVCLNWFDGQGEPLFPPSAVREVGGIRVGIIGFARPREEGSLDFNASLDALAREAARIDDQADLMVVVAHAGLADGEAMAAAAPQVDVVVSGHTHTMVHDPRIHEETGALIVQAGSYAEYVGHLELTIDPETKKITRHANKLAEMTHAAIPADAEVLAMIQQAEAKHCPEAAKPVITLEDSLGIRDIGVLAAAALREQTGSDIAFFHTGQILRDYLAPGPADVNAVFRTGGQRAEDIVRATLTGETIRGYLARLANTDWGQTTWCGMRAKQEGRRGNRTITTSLDPDAAYTVVMPLREWETRFLRWVEKDAPGGKKPADFHAETVPGVSFTSSVTQYIRTLKSDEAALRARIETLAQAADW